MTSRLRLGRFISIVGTATVGLLAAHELDYRLIVPDPMHRHDLLLRTGHGYLSKAPFVALIVALMSIVSSLALGVARGRMGSARAHTRSVVTFLALVQGGGFLVMEGAERIIVGAPPDDRLWLVTLTGITVQVLAACVGALLLRLFERAGEAIGRRLRHALPRVVSGRSFGLGPQRAIIGASATVGFASRAPPILVY